MSQQDQQHQNEPPVDDEGGFFAEYWIWILAPLVLIMGALIYMVLFMGGEDSAFQYSIM